jgi:preprotein translocase subunit SecD
MTDETLDPCFERDLRAVLGDLAPADAPAALYGFVAAVPSDRPAGRRVGPFRGRRPYLLLAAAAAVVIAVVAIASALQPRRDLPAVGGEVTPAPSGALQLYYEVLPVDRLGPSIADIQQIQDQLGARLRAAGLAEFRIGLTTLGDRTTVDIITVDIPALPDDSALVGEIRALLGATGRLDFVPLGNSPVETGQVIDLEQFPPLFSGAQVTDVTVGSDQSGARTLDFMLGPDGTSLFADYTAAHIGEYFAIALDGKALSVPVIMEAIPNGTVQISQGGIGGFPEDEAQRLIAILKSGALPFPLQEVTPEPQGP